MRLTGTGADRSARVQPGMPACVVHLEGCVANSEKRIEALERRIVFDPITLFFADGSSTQIGARRDYVLNLFAAACRGERSPQVELIARSVRSPAGYRDRVASCPRRQGRRILQSADRNYRRGAEVSRLRRYRGP